MDNSLENMRQALYASIRSFVDAVLDARYHKTPEEKQQREKEAFEAMTSRIFGDN